MPLRTKEELASGPNDYVVYYSRRKMGLLLDVDMEELRRQIEVREPHANARA